MSIRDHVLELITLFNRQKTDLPDGVLRKDCVLRLNGRAYHEQLGRSPQDPLVRLIGCGPAGYRFVLSALRHAVREPRLTLQEPSVAEESTGHGSRLRARGTLSGRLRGRGDAVAIEFLLDVEADDAGRVRELATTLGDADVELLLEARQRP
jgi:hypothetical protein